MIILPGTDLNDLFEQVFLYKSGSFEAKDTRALILESVLKEVEDLNYNMKKNPYENFLETVFVRLLIDSLSIGKALLGSIWAGGGLVSGPPGRHGKSSFTYFALNIQEKNEMIVRLRNKLSEYPENLVYISNEYEINRFNKDHSQHATFLEYRASQISFKVLLQEICLHSHHLTTEDKKSYDERLNCMKMTLKTYPVI